jgi:hypothetical protein
MSVAILATDDKPTSDEARNVGGAFRPRNELEPEDISEERLDDKDATLYSRATKVSPVFNFIRGKFVARDNLF